ncbi:MAG: hypothetical protein HYV93_09150 [Candidatus Rokubacteria bacterium]|nr:hypothetical protein [Candidatus Rokubacteria bacterium]
MKRQIAVLVIAAGLAMAIAPAANAFTLPPFGPYAGNNGDFQAYSIPLMNLFFFGDQNFNGPGSFSVDSSPGKIKDFVVIGSFPAAGRNNEDVLGKNNGDDAYETINAGSGINYDTICQSKTGGIPGCADYTGSGADFKFVGAKDPGGTGEFTGDVAGTWDVKISTLESFLAGSDLVFFFNQNQNNTSQDIFGWGYVTLIDTDPAGGTATPKCYEFNASQIGFLAFTGDCAHTGPPGGAFNPLTDMNGGDFLNTANPGEFSFSAGQVCLLPGPPAVQVPCSTPGAITVNHNLGADEAAFALFSPELNNQLKDPSNPYTVMQIRFAFGDSNNGFEQIFIAALQSVTPPVPAPATVVLLGAALLSLSLLGLRRCRTR